MSFQTSSSGLSSGEYGGRKNSLSLPHVEATYFRTAAERCTACPSTMRKTDLFAPCISRFRNAMNLGAVSVPGTTMKRSIPRGLIAEIRLMLSRPPIAGMMGVMPTGAQLVPAW